MTKSQLNHTALDCMHDMIFQNQIGSHPRPGFTSGPGRFQQLKLNQELFQIRQDDFDMLLFQQIREQIGQFFGVIASDLLAGMG
jgi:hypothetical protein